jgi:hypothetical protein
MYNYQYTDEGVYENTAKSEIALRAFRQPENVGFNDDRELQGPDTNNVDTYYLDNINQFNKFNLSPEEIKSTNASNIIKYNNTLTLNDFDKLMIAREYRQLYDKSRDVNDFLEKEYEKTKLENLSLREIFNNFINNMTQLVQELPDVFSKETPDYSIFTKGERLTYLGIFMVIIGFLLFFADVSF